MCQSLRIKLVGIMFSQILSEPSGVFKRVWCTVLLVFGSDSSSRVARGIRCENAPSLLLYEGVRDLLAAVDG